MKSYWHNVELLNEISAFDFFEWACKRRGWVYLALNENGLVKIGRTSKTPHSRMKSLYSAGASKPLLLLDFILFVDSFWAETNMHRHFVGSHVDREYYRVDLAAAKTFLKDCKKHEISLCSNLNYAFLLHAPISETYTYPSK